MSIVVPNEFFFRDGKIIIRYKRPRTDSESSTATNDLQETQKKPKRAHRKRNKLSPELLQLDSFEIFDYEKFGDLDTGMCLA